MKSISPLIISLYSFIFYSVCHHAISKGYYTGHMIKIIEDGNLFSYFSALLNNPAVLNMNYTVCQCCNLWIVGNHHDSLVKFPAGHFQQTNYIIASLAVQVSSIDVDLDTLLVEE